MATSFEKIKTFLAIVITNCQTKKPFRMIDATRAASLTSNAGTIIKRLGMVEAGKSIGDGSREWRWLSPHGLGQLNDLAVELSAALKVYQDSFVKQPPKKEVAPPPPALPFSGPRIDTTGIERSHNLEDISIISDPLEQMPPERAFQNTTLYFLKDLIQKVDALTQKASKMEEDTSAMRKWIES